jgi:hypothetical protein
MQRAGGKLWQWFRLMLISLFLFFTAPATLTIITRLINARNVAADKLTFHRHIRTEVNSLLST